MDWMDLLVNQSNFGLRKWVIWKQLFPLDEVVKRLTSYFLYDGIREPHCSSLGLDQVKVQSKILGKEFLDALSWFFPLADHTELKVFLMKFAIFPDRNLKCFQTSKIL